MEGVLIGTSGYDYPEWVGSERFYPPSLDGRRCDWLTYYASQFPIVELNFTYYGETSPAQLERMLARVDSSRRLYLLEGDYSPRPEFCFTIKAYPTLTHQLDKHWRDHVVRFRTHIQPLIESDRLAGILAQFPSRFRSTRQTATFVVRLAEMLSPLPLIAEFRHHGWYSPDTVSLLRQHGVVVAGIDTPSEAGLPSAIDSGESGDPAAGALPFGYFRLHGRREGMWWEGDAASRYEYDYPTETLARLARRLSTSMLPKNLVLFNNHRHADAAKNARALGELLASLRAADPPVPARSA